MGLIRKDAVQGHAIPRGPHSPRGPFPLEIYQRSERAVEEDWVDSLPDELHDIRYFFCRDCGAVVGEYDRQDHICEEEEE